jgi:hypothetical protein
MYQIFDNLACTFGIPLIFRLFALDILPDKTTRIKAVFSALLSFELAVLVLIGDDVEFNEGASFGLTLLLPVFYYHGTTLAFRTLHRILLSVLLIIV